MISIQSTIDAYRGKTPAQRYELFCKEMGIKIDQIKYNTIINKYLKHGHSNN